MKKILCLAVVAVILTGVVIAFSSKKEEIEPMPTEAYIRVHIRANSNSEVDQEVKYAVKEAVVSYLTPIIADCETVSQAHCAISKNLSNIDRVANGVLKSRGFNYLAKSRINDEYFPTRAYADTVLDEGFYDALIVDLGSGTGNNWWCVVYPPLCFIGSEAKNDNNLVYMSKIVELINKLCK